MKPVFLIVRKTVSKKVHHSEMLASLDNGHHAQQIVDDLNRDMAEAFNALEALKFHGRGYQWEVVKVSHLHSENS